MTDVVLDSGALSMFAAADPRLLANLNRRLKGTRTVPLDESDARSAAARRTAGDGDDAADPAVVAAAARLDAVVVATDPGDISALVDAGDPRVAAIVHRN